MFLPVWKLLLLISELIMYIKWILFEDKHSAYNNENGAAYYVITIINLLSGGNLKKSCSVK